MIIYKKMLAVSFILFLLIVTGCGDSDTIPEEDGISIEVANNTEEIVITYAAFFGEDLDEWGEDLLGDEIIAPGETVTFVLPEGEYDLSLFNQDFFVINSTFNISEDIRVDVGGGGKVPVLVQNASDHDILFFFVLPGELIDFDPGNAEDEALDAEDETLDEDWAETWAEIWEDEDIFNYQLLDDREVIIAESGRRFFFIAPGTYDFLIVNEEIEPFFNWGIEIEEGDRKVITVQ